MRATLYFLLTNSVAQFWIRSFDNLIYSKDSTLYLSVEWQMLYMDNGTWFLKRKLLTVRFDYYLFSIHCFAFLNYKSQLKVIIINIITVDVMVELRFGISMNFSTFAANGSCLMFSTAATTMATTSVSTTTLKLKEIIIFNRSVRVAKAFSIIILACKLLFCLGSCGKPQSYKSNKFTSNDVTHTIIIACNKGDIFVQQFCHWYFLPPPPCPPPPPPPPWPPLEL